MAGSEDPKYASADLSGVVEMFAYAHAAAEARVDDDLGDVTSRLVRPDADGQRLSSEEFAFFFMILAVAGNETTRQAITHGMLAFLQHPDQWERWRSERPATAVDEILRWASPAVVLQRTATEDTEVAGQPGPARASGWACTSPPPTSTRRCSTTPSVSTSAARPIPTSPSAPAARTTASGPTSPAWS